MATSGKYGTVTGTGGDLGADEPVFVIRARDSLAQGAVRAYLALCQESGASDAHVAGVWRALDDIRAWQQAHAPHAPD